MALGGSARCTLCPRYDIKNHLLDSMLSRLFSYGYIAPQDRERSYLDRLFNRSYLLVYFFLLMLVVNDLYRPYLGDPRMQEPLYRVAFLPLFWSVVLYMGLSAIKSVRLYRPVAIGLATLGAVSFFFEMFLLEAYRSVYSYTIAYAMLATNPAETEEFWTSTVHLGLFVRPVLYYIGICLLSYVVHLVIRPLRIHSRALVLGGLALPLVVGVGYFYPRMYYIYYTTFDGGIATATLTPPERYFWGTFQCLYDARQTEKAFEALAQNAGQVEVTYQERLSPHTLVLVIGESLRADYMHCYGFPLPNTPELDSLVATGDLAVFSDVVSCTQSTGGSIAEMMAFRQVDTPTPWHEAYILPDVMKSGGYSTYWLSRQEKYSAYVRTISAIAQLSDRTMYVDRGKDDVLLPYLREHSEQAPYLFEVLHLYGSHPAYEERYPSEYARFSAEDMPVRRDAQKDATVAHYVNSIYYSDHVAASIMKHYAHTDAIVVYVSDHGQAMYDDPDNPSFAGHALSRGGVTVPLLVYVSPPMAAKHPDLKARIFAARDRRIMTDILPYAVTGLVGMRVPGYDSRLDFFSDGYDNTRKRIAYMGDKRLIIDP